MMKLGEIKSSDDGIGEIVSSDDEIRGNSELRYWNLGKLRAQMMKLGEILSSHVKISENLTQIMILGKNFQLRW